MNIAKGPTNLRNFGKKSTAEKETNASEIVSVSNANEGVLPFEKPVDENVEAMNRKDKCRHGGTDDSQANNSKRLRFTTDGASEVETSILAALSKLSTKDSLLTISKVMHNVASNLDDFVPREDFEKMKKDLERMKRAKEKAVKASHINRQRLKAVFHKIDALNDELQFHKTTGALSPKYPALVVDRLMKTNAFFEFFVNTTSLAKDIGASEGLKGYRQGNVVDDGFPTIEQLDKVIAEDSEKATVAFISSIRTGGYDFPFVKHLEMLRELPSLEQLKACNVDYNEQLPSEMRPSSSAVTVGIKIENVGESSRSKKDDGDVGNHKSDDDHDVSA